MYCNSIYTFLYFIVTLFLKLKNVVVDDDDHFFRSIKIILFLSKQVTYYLQTNGKQKLEKKLHIKLHYKTKSIQIYNEYNIMLLI